MENKIFGWFPHENQVKLDEIIKEHDIKTVIEIGSFVGLSTAFFAKRVDHVWAIDPFTLWPEGRENGDARQYGEDFYYKFAENMKNERVLTKVTPVRMTSREASERLNNVIEADLVYVDGSHDYESVKEDLILWGSFAKKFICGDDYDHNWPGVMKAVDEIYPQRQVYGNLWIAPILDI